MSVDMSAVVGRDALLKLNQFPTKSRTIHLIRREREREERGEQQALPSLCFLFYQLEDSLKVQWVGFFFPSNKACIFHINPILS